MTTKEAYEKIREYFSQPDAVYGVDDGTNDCRYRTAEGYKCAVGCLIPDKLYYPTMESWDILTIQENIEALSEVSKEFLEKAQTAHDQSTINGLPMSEFIERLDNIAERYV